MILVLNIAQTKLMGYVVVLGGGRQRYKSGSEEGPSN